MSLIVAGIVKHTLNASTIAGGVLAMVNWLSPIFGLFLTIAGLVYYYTLLKPKWDEWRAKQDAKRTARVAAFDLIARRGNPEQ